MGGHEGALTVVQHQLLLGCKHFLDSRILIEVVTQFLVDGLVHPVKFLLAAFFVEIAIAFHKVEVIVYHLPHLGDAYLVVARVGQHSRRPAAWRQREQVQGIAELGGGKVGTVHVVAVGLVDYYSVGHLHDAALYALQLVACARKLNEQEEIDHRVHGCLALAHAHGLHKYLVETCRLAQHYGFTRLARHTAERTCRRAGADECVGVHRQLFHARLVAQYAPLRAFAAGVDGEHGELAPLF